MTGLGLDLESSWRGLLEGRSPIKRFELFDPQGLESPFGVELPPEVDELFTSGIKKRRQRQMTRGTMMAVLTARMAIEDAGLDGETLDRGRVGVVLGTTGTGYVPPAGGEVDEHRILRNMINAPASWISLEGKFTGPSFIISTACSSGANALGTAQMLIDSGRCDVVISGAADSSINHQDVGGFSSLMALADWKGPVAEASRPFDKDRCGFVMGEGGGVLVLESVESARARDARVYALMPQPALTSEAYNIISPRRGGKGMAETMRLALDQAGLAPRDIQYINAHGTSTPYNDLYETLAIKEVFGEHAPALAISSTKSMTGHCLAGAAGVEAVIACKALFEGMIPPTINLKTPDPELDLDFVPNKARPLSMQHVMSNSFAFGGHNGVNIFSRPDHGV